MRVLVLADTHIPDHAKALPVALRPELERAELILHAGDVSSAVILDELRSFAPVHCALGNNDGLDVAAWGAEEELEFAVGDVVMAMVHDSGPRPGRERRLRKRFPEARLIVFGHSHIPLDYEDGGVRFFNPGSPTWKRMQPSPTFGRLDVSGNEIRSEIVPLAMPVPIR